MACIPPSSHRARAPPVSRSSETSSIVDQFHPAFTTGLAGLAASQTHARPDVVAMDVLSQLPVPPTTAAEPLVVTVPSAALRQLHTEQNSSIRSAVMVCGLVLPKVVMSM